MSDQPYHNKGFGLAFITIILAMFILPVVAMMTLDDTFERFLQKYGDPFTTECWENSKHERVCKGEVECKFGRNFCIEEGYRWRAK